MPYLFLSLRNKRKISAISLHGSVFLNWRKEDRITKFFLLLVRFSDCVTCLGNGQRQHLISLGVPERKVRVVYNAVKESNECKNSSSDGISILYLSNLIKEKGYDTFLEAVQDLSTKVPSGVSVKLVGRLLASDNSSAGSEGDSRWIQEKVNTINKSKNTSIEWIHGAYGAEKEKLFHDASIFVFPTRYKVEAQPIVLIEAMAARCALITTRMGEIPEALGNAAVYVDENSVSDLSESLLTFLKRKDLRHQYSTRARKRYETVFSFEKHKEVWSGIYQL